MTEGNGEARELPKGWKWSFTDQICELVTTGNTPKQAEMSDQQGEIPYIKIHNLTKKGTLDYLGRIVFISRETHQDKLKKSKIFPGDVLMNIVGPPLGKVAIVPNIYPEWNTNQNICIFRTFTNLFYNKYLAYCLLSNQTLSSIIYKSTTTAGQIFISLKNCKSLLIPTPPLIEQERIVEKIEELFSELDQGLENLKTAQKQLKVYRQAVLKWAFEGELTEQWRQQAQQQGTLRTGEELLAQIKAERENRYQQQVAEWEAAVKTWEANGKPGKKPSKPSKPKNLPPLTPTELAEIPQLPGGWCWERAGNIFCEINNGYTPTKEKLNPENGEVPFLKVYNLTHNGGLDFKDLTLVSRETHEQELTRSITYPNDVLFNIVGPPLGKVSLVPPKYPEYNINQAVVLFRPSHLYLPKFLMYALLTKSVINWILKTGKATAGQTNLKVSACREQPLPVCSFEEQEQVVQEIESRLSNCDQLETAIAENLQKAEALRQSILKQAFEGKLVPQDLNDEPAEKLLERIRAEQQARGNTGKRNQSKQRQLTLPEV